MKYKKQHWIPKSYLQAWCDPDTPSGYDDYVWVYSTDGKDVKKRNPKNIFYENDMYTIHLEDGSRNLDIEHGLAGLEDAFAQVRKNTLFNKGKISPEDRLIILAFIAASLSRTAANEKHLKEQWGETLDLMKALREEVRNMTPEQRKDLSLLGPISSGKDNKLTFDDVERLANKPLQEMLMVSIRTQVELFMKMNLCIMCTDDEIGFITSDAPCVWFDPKAYKRPAMYRSPGLGYPTIEVTLPISPNQKALISHCPLKEYIDIPKLHLDETNRMTRFYADEYFVVRKNYINPLWFIERKPPKIRK